MRNFAWARSRGIEIFLAAISDLIGQKVDGIVLGCTEIGMLIQQSHTRIPDLGYNSTACPSLG